MTPAEASDRDKRLHAAAYKLGEGFAGYRHVAEEVAKAMKGLYPMLAKKVLEGYEAGQGALDDSYDLFGY